MQAHARHNLKLAGTLALAFVHVWLAIIAFFDLLSFTQPSRFDVIELAADSRWWGWVFTANGLALIAGMLRHPFQHNEAMSKLCSISAAILGTWAFFTLLWGLTTSFPVSLAVFGPAVFAVVGAQVLAVSWRHGN